MAIIEIKRENSNICIFYNNNLIEQYKLTEAIDFKELMKLLINDELSNKFQCIMEENLNPNDEETSLISIINNIIDEYNSKIDEFSTFISTMENDG